MRQLLLRSARRSASAASLISSARPSSGGCYCSLCQHRRLPVTLNQRGTICFGCSSICRRCRHHTEDVMLKERSADARRRPYSCNGLHAMRMLLLVSTGDATESFCQFRFRGNVIYGALRQVIQCFSGRTVLSAGAVRRVLFSAAR